MKLTLIREERPYEFRWWSGTVEKYEVCFHYGVQGAGPELADGEYHVAVGWRDAFGANRRRILAFRTPTQVHVELVGTDEWSETRKLAWLLKVPGGNRNIGASADLPEEFKEFEIERFNEWITGPSARRGYAVRIDEDDHESIVRLGLIREQHKKRPAPAEPVEIADEEPDGAVADVAGASVPVESDAIIPALANYARDYVPEHLFACVSRIAGHDVETPGEAYAALSSPTASLSLLLGYFAFARQGAERAGYDRASLTLLRPYLQDPERFWEDYPDGDAFHTAFVAECDRRGIRQNPRINPGLIRDLYGRAARTPDRGVFHVWASQIREHSRVQEVFSDLVDVHGIGEKIASFICRDTVFLAGLEDTVSDEERKYLQPVDIWIGRVAEFLNPDLTFGRDNPLVISEYLARACMQQNVSGVSFNQGAWYYGSQVAGSAQRLTELLMEIAGPVPAWPRHRRRSKRLVVVACGKRKVWDEQPDRGECAARDAYTGSFFNANRKYAERFAPEDWAILSARFGLIHPDTPITNYDTTFQVASPDTIATDQIRVTAHQLGATDYQEIEVLGGQEYVERLREALSGHRVEVLAPYADCGSIVQMIGKATAALGAGVPMIRLGKHGAAAEPEPAEHLGIKRRELPAGPGRPPRGRPNPTSNPEFIRRVFELYQGERRTQLQTIMQAAEEFGISLPKSYLRYPGVNFHRWRSQGYGRK